MLLTTPILSVKQLLVLIRVALGLVLMLLCLLSMGRVTSAGNTTAGCAPFPVVAEGTKAERGSFVFIFLFNARKNLEN